MAILYTTALSANGRKALAVRHHLGLDVAVEQVNVYAGEGQRPGFLAVNPLGKIPTLVDGELVLWESNAILVYMAEAWGDCALWSREAKGRGEILRWLFWEGSQWAPAVGGVLAAFVGHRLGVAVQDTEPVADWTDGALGRQLAFLEGQLDGSSHLVGERLTLADFSVAGMMTYFGAAGFPFERYPGIARWYAGLEELDAWKRTALPVWA